MFNKRTYRVAFAMGVLLVISTAAVGSMIAIAWTSMNNTMDVTTDSYSTEGYIEQTNTVLAFKDAVRVIHFREPVRTVDYQEAMRIIDFKDAMRVIHFREPVRTVDYQEAVRVIDFKDAMRVIHFNPLQVLN